MPLSFYPDQSILTIADGHPDALCYFPGPPSDDPNAGGDTPRFRDLASVSLGLATIAARRSTAHGGRASQARGDDDPAPADQIARVAGSLHWNQAGPTRVVGPAFCVSRNPRK